MRVYQITVDGRVIFVRADSAETALRIAKNTVGSGAQLANNGQPVTEGAAREAAGAQFIRQNGDSQFARGVTISGDRDRGNFFDTNFSYPVLSDTPIEAPLPSAPAVATDISTSDLGGLESISGGEFPFAAFARGVGAQGLDPTRGAFSGLVAGQADPLGQTFRVRQLIGQEPQGRSFQDFVAGTPLSQTPSLSLEAFRSVFGGGGTDPSGLGAETLGDFRAGTSQIDRRQAALLARSAAGAQFSPFTASFLPSTGEFERRFQADPTEGDAFRAFLQSQFGLR